MLGVNIGWNSLLDPTHTLLNSIVRGTIVYLALYAVLRVAHNRRSGNVSVSDLLVVTLIGNAVQNSLVGEGRSLTEGAVSSGTILFWSFALDWLAFRFPRLRWLLRSKPQEVIRDGKVVEKGLRRELMTKDELTAQLRIQGVQDIAKVEMAFVEASGNLSVVLRG